MINIHRQIRDGSARTNEHKGTNEQRGTYEHRGTHEHRGRHRGMVTAELAVGLLAVVLVLAAAAGMAATLQLQARCLDSASEIARQSARGDEAAVARALEDLPPRATVDRRRDDGAIIVTVTAPVRLVPLPAFEVSATAETILEPGT